MFGDSNTRYTRSGDNPSIFSTDNGMTDAWVQLVRSGVAPVAGTDALVCSNPSTVTTCETVDKVWYRGSPAVTLQATKFQYAGNMFLQTNGDILSDHNPVLVDFSWTSNAQLRAGGVFGGESGTWFNDLSTLASTGSQVSSVTLRGSSRVDAISLTLSSGQTLTHGGTGGTATTLSLTSGERLVGATLCSGEKDGKTRIFYAQLRTSSARSISAGVKTSVCVERTVESGWGIVGTLGRSGDEVDQLGFVFGKA